MKNSNYKLCIDADIGEAFGNFRMGQDEVLMPLITSANIACGFHAGDPVVMMDSIKLAQKNDICIGAHPGFNDIWGFGRRRIQMSARDIEYMVTYQIGALSALAQSVGARVEYVKPHGALNNMAHEEKDLAAAIARGIRAADRELVFVANCLSEMIAAGETAGLKVAHEAYADRNYLPDGRLMPRNQEDAIIREPNEAAERTIAMLTRQELIAHDGTVLKSRVDTFCIHGDEPTAVSVTTAIRKKASKEGIAAATVSQLGI